MRTGFDNEKYIIIQSERIKKRIAEFGGKLYLEFGGKLFDDYHASRVLPGFEPDTKIRMLKSIGSDVEIIIAICTKTCRPYHADAAAFLGRHERKPNERERRAAASEAVERRVGFEFLTEKERAAKDRDVPVKLAGRGAAESRNIT